MLIKASYSGTVVAESRFRLRSVLFFVNVVSLIGQGWSPEVANLIGQDCRRSPSLRADST